MRCSLASFLLAWLVLPAQAADTPRPTSADERLLRAAHLGTDGPALLDFLKKRAADPIKREGVVELVRQVAEGTAQADRAFGELVARGPAALVSLKEELKNAR